MLKYNPAWSLENTSRELEKKNTAYNTTASIIVMEIIVQKGY